MDETTKGTILETLDNVTAQIGIQATALESFTGILVSAGTRDQDVDMWSTLLDAIVSNLRNARDEVNRTIDAIQGAKADADAL